MQTRATTKPPAARRNNPVAPATVVDQLIEIADWNSRHPKDTTEQKQAIAVKELLQKNREQLIAA
jgi:hypothetical protein